MKATMKKVLSMVLVVALVASASIMGTMAYLTTDAGKEKNVFSVGNIDISLDEEVDVYGEGGEVKENEDKDGANYTDIMPGDYLKKEVTVTNNGKTDAYVAVTVDVNNFSQIRKAIEAYGEDDANAEAMLDFVFDGWGMTVQDRYVGETKDMSYKINELVDSHILHVDSAKRIVANDVAHFSIENWFKSDAEKTSAGYTVAGVGKSYYAQTMEDYSLRYTYYIYLPAGESATLFNGLNVPAEFTNAQMAMFSGLVIDVEAKAIQADNMGIAEEYADDETYGKAKTAFAVLAGTIKAEDLGVDNTPERIVVENTASLLAAIDEAEAGDTIILSENIDLGSTEVVNIDKAITLDLGGNTISSKNRNNAVKLSNGASLKNGTIAHSGTVAGIKVWGAESIENVTIELSGVSSAGNVITGISVQEGACYIQSLKNVTVTSTGSNKVYNGIETYNCGDRTDYAIGSMENVTVDVNGTALVLSAPVGTATNCTFKGGAYGINAHLKGAYSVSLTLVDCEVSGGTYGILAWDEPEYTNPGFLKLVGENTTVTGGVVEQASASEEFGDRWSVTGLK